MTDASSTAGTMSASEVFRDAPLQLVAAEVTFPAQAVSSQVGALDAVRAAIEDPDARVELAPALMRIKQGSETPESALFRVIALDSTVAVTAWRGSLVLEHTDYEHWASFRGLLERLATSLAEVSSPEGLQRVGLRYVDELHVPDRVTDIRMWKRFVDPAFLALPDWSESSVSAMSGALAVTRRTNLVLNVRYATFSGRALDASGPLRLRDRPDSPAFLLDVDAVYEPAELDKDAVRPEVLMDIFDALHEEADLLFNRAFTEAAREVFRGVSMEAAGQ